MIMLLFYLISLTGYCLAAKRHLGYAIQITPFFTLSLLICILYTATFFNVLSEVSMSLIWVGAGLFLVETLQATSLRILRHPVMISFWIISIILWFIMQPAILNAWDEFSHWGVISKHLYLTSQFAKPGSIVTFLDYPPAEALGHYFFYKYMGYSEGIAYFAQGLLLLTPLLCFWQKSAKWMWILVFMLFFNFAHGILPHLYVDPILGVFFGMTLVSYFLSEKKSSDILRLIPMCMVLVLLKGAGILLASIIVLTILCDRRSWAILILALSIFAAHFSWKLYIQEQNIRPAFKTDAGIAEIKRSFTPAEATPRDVKTWRAFGRALISERIDKGISYKDKSVNTAFVWCLLLLVITILNYRALTTRTLRIELISAQIILWLGLLMYAGGLLILYLHSYAESEGIRVASFARYISIYFLGWILVNFAFLLKAYHQESSRRKYIQYAYGILVVAAFGGLIAGLVFLFKPHKNPEPLRVQVKEVAKQVSHQIPENAKVYVIWQGDSGLAWFMLRYELFFQKLNEGCWNIVLPGQQREVWDCEITPDEWNRRLKEYDYLLLAKTDPEFLRDFGIVGAKNLSPSKMLLSSPNKVTLIKLPLHH